MTMAVAGISILTLGVGLILALPVLLFICFSIYIHYIRAKYSHLPSPKPEGFYLGHARLIQKLAKTEPSTFVFKRWHKEIGPIYVIRFFTRIVVFVEDAAVVKELLTRSKYTKPPQQYRTLRHVFGARALGDGLLTESDHEKWKKKRTLFNPAFHRNYLMGMMNEFNAGADKLVEHLTQFADGTKEVTMLNEFERLTMEIIARVGFGMQDEFISDPNSQLRVLFAELLGGMMAAFRKPFLKYSILPGDLQYKSRLRAGVSQIRGIGRRVVEARMAAIQRGEDVPRDILTYILQGTDNLKGTFGLEDMIDEFLTFFGAGQETTANLMSFTLFHLAQNPDVTQKLREEVDSVLGGRTFVEYADIGKLQYMTLVLKESLRINPPVASQSRKLPSEMTMCGYKVPKDATVLMSIYGMGRNEKHFKNPDKFDPERFARNEDSPLFAFFPFSLGSRSCIGQTFALIETKVTFCKLIQSLKFSLVPGQSNSFTEDVTLKPKDGCKTFITARKSDS